MQKPYCLEFTKRWFCSCHCWWISGALICFVFPKKISKKGEKTFFPFPVIKTFYSDFPFQQDKGFPPSKIFCLEVKNGSNLVHRDDAIDYGSWSMIADFQVFDFSGWIPIFSVEHIWWVCLQISLKNSLDKKNLEGGDKFINCLCFFLYCPLKM